MISSRTVEDIYYTGSSFAIEHFFQLTLGTDISGFVIAFQDEGGSALEHAVHFLLDLSGCHFSYVGFVLVEFYFAVALYLYLF